VSQCPIAGFYMYAEINVLSRCSTTSNPIQIPSWILRRVYGNDDPTGTGTAGEDMTDVPVIPAQYG
jgi:5,10-methylenetetrahydrofolate reductase